VQPVHLHPTVWRSILILSTPSTHGSSDWSPSLGFPHQHSVCTSADHYTCQHHCIHMYHSLRYAKETEGKGIVITTVSCSKGCWFVSRPADRFFWPSLCCFFQFLGQVLAAERLVENWLYETYTETLVELAYRWNECTVITCMSVDWSVTRMCKRTGRQVGNGRGCEG
jgi:hypothetical protein